MAKETLTAGIIYLPEESQWERMLEPILFAPGALWVSKSLLWAGVEKFLVVCPAEVERSARSCFPEEAEFVASDDENLSQAWNTFLDKIGGRAVVMTRPALFFRQGAELLAGEAPLPEADGEEDDPFTGVRRWRLEELAKATPGRLEEGGEPLYEEVWDLEALSGSENRGAAQWCAKRMTADYWLSQGVSMLDPEQVYIAPTVTLEPGTLVLPGTILRGETHIGKDCEIGPNTMLRDARVGDFTTVNASQCSECVIGSHTTVGPFAYIRPNTTVGDHVKVGDFVELKNSVIGDETKISHLTYVGDSDVGEHINFGCGTVTVNYDGAKKFRTKIGDGAFIGCNTNLVAPVTVGPGAYIAAGSTITRDVPSDSLAIARSQQTVKNQWAKKRRSKQQGK